MPVKIAHLSDIHWESRDTLVYDRLITALKRESPDLLIFTGDLVNNPWSLKQAKSFLLTLCSECGLKPEQRLLIVPGNHDYRIWGNVGLRSLSGWLFFRRQFRCWIEKRVHIFKELNVTCFRFDSNPLIWGFARGRIGWLEFRRIRREWDSLCKDDRDAIQNSVRIALVHHHVLPIPHAGRDTFLVLEDAQRLL